MVKSTTSAPKYQEVLSDHFLHSFSLQGSEGFQASHALRSCLQKML